MAGEAGGRERLAAKAGLPVIKLHALRHSYATAALEAGVDAKVLSERLGRSSISITLDVYGHGLPGREAAGVQHPG